MKKFWLAMVALLSAVVMSSCILVVNDDSDDKVKVTVTNAYPSSYGIDTIKASINGGSLKTVYTSPKTSYEDSFSFKVDAGEIKFTIIYTKKISSATDLCESKTFSKSKDSTLKLKFNGSSVSEIY